MRNRQLSGEDTVSYYWRTYYEWRIAYGLQDDCMNELFAAVQLVMEQEPLSDEQLDRLRHLTNIIETERRLALACVA